MLKQIFRSLKNADEWYTKDGEETIILGKAISYGNGNDMIFINPKTGKKIAARYGTTDADGEFLRFWHNNGNNNGRTASIKDQDYASRAGYYVEL